MKTFGALTVAAVLLGITGVAHAADIIISPPLPTVFPADGRTGGACYVRNTGNKAVSVAVTTFSNNGVAVLFDNCNDGPLANGETCVVLTQLPDASFAACSATAESVKNLRGTFEIRDPISAPVRVLVAGDLR